MCFEGWKGDNCNQDIDECTERDHICQNGGSCTITLGSFECACVAGIKGKLCENIINQCALKPCLNGGTCDGNESDFKCACPVEWTGDTCADKVNFCDSAPCNMGQCTPDLLTATRFKCDCDFPWVGERCNQSVDIFNITLLGEIDHTNRGDLVDGLKRLIIELGGIPGKVNVTFRTNTKKESNYTTTHVHLYSAVENGSFLESSSFDRIFESNPDEVIDEYLPLPLFPPREEEEVKAKSPHDSWDTNQYVSAIPPPVGLVLIPILLLVAFCIWRRSNKTEQCRDDIQLDSFVMDVACNPQPPGAMTRNLQGASVSPDGYTSLRFLGSPDTHCDETSNIISLEAEDITLDPETLEGLGLYPAEAHRDDTLNIHLTTEDMALDPVIIHRFGVSPNDNGRLGDVATLQPVTEDLTLDPVIEQDARVSPHDNTHDCDKATLHDVEVATLDTHCDEASNALPTTETGALDSVRPSGYPDDHTRLGDFGTLDTRRHVTSYIQPVPGDMTLDPGNLKEEEDNAEYTVIDDNEVEDILQEDPFETIESVDDKDDENISQKNLMKR
ncbi:uncharacterized protein LOC124278294 [Haliotis rubra]|uniref:uncharacterized protein LOC124278294 n=1 Tax=Haliotis rubra TaxID=36100 RepID=UPI001EE5284F|nr:uncharacterized protein LOC124278294 [Haliotis rubra]